ncbi:DNA-binding protein [Nesterenkonia sp. AN1]|uniref:helix-turn-helix transcriptional regulator n=1 Tax=Nesterenkonia sp. AN1 TaxID=652017 RepID=UPI0004516046|nr:helix-turn-helix transcriptional regulator [Nesterenkonia sp. AN1]EXF25921.1 DNA-binding protein [Nesterenkonia sp. AN1]
MKNLVHESRRRLAWSQQKLADELGVSRQTIISIERGRFDPSLPLAFRIAAVFDCTIEEIFLPEDQS